MDNYKPLSQLVSTHPAFRELAKWVMDEHLKRRPAIDEKMRPLRLKAWQDWNDNLPADHFMKNKMPTYLFGGGNLI